jgi:hypothetical protein
MQTQHIALVPEAGGLSPSELLRVSAALQKQVSTQFGPFWDVQASVDAFAEIEDVPAGYRPIVLSLPDNASGVAGVHLDENGQPYGRVMLAPGWSIDASRACLEMLVNPFGQRTLSAPSPRSDQGPAEILLEVCAAFGDVPRAYAVNDVPVSDFCTPAFFDSPAPRSSERYSYRGGSFTAPLQLLRGGHLAWFDAISNSWWLRTFNEEHPSDVSLGSMRASSRSKSVRQLVMRHEPVRALALLHREPMDARIGLQWLRDQASMASRARAQRLRMLLVGSPDSGDSVIVKVPRELRARDLGQELRETVESELDGLGSALPVSGHVREVESTHVHEVEVDEVDAREAAWEQGVGAREAAWEQRRETLPHGPRLEWRGSPQQTSDRAPGDPNMIGTQSAPTLQPQYEQPPSSSDARAPTRQQVDPHAPTRQQDTAPASVKPRENVAKASPKPRGVAAPSAARAPSVPPLPQRPSSIAPVAMLDSAARPEGSRLGMILIGAAVAALAIAGWMSSDSSQARQAATQPRPAAPAPVANPVANPAPSVQQIAPAPVPVAPTPAENKVEAHPPAREQTVEPRALVHKPVEARGSAREQNSDATSDKGPPRQRRSKQQSSLANAEPPTEKAQPADTLESLFDTRR